MATAAILNFTKMLLWALMNLITAYGQCLSTYKILHKYFHWSLRWCKNINPRWRLHFIKSGINWATVIVVWPTSVCTPNVTQKHLSVTKIWPSSKLKMAATTILNFTESGIVSNGYRCITNVCPQTKFDAMLTEICPKIQIQDGGRRHFEFYQKWHIGLE